MTLQPIGKLKSFTFNDKDLGQGTVLKKGTVFDDARGNQILNRFGNKVQVFVQPVSAKKGPQGSKMPQRPNPAAAQAKKGLKAVVPDPDPEVLENDEPSAQ
jgi:hypothetical protein